ncbi:MAG TPA: hypothetical protein VHG72_05735, partial [Polyangia bacterium]|nr:hypothetical protein [Polyangia bacterium]
GATGTGGTAGAAGTGAAGSGGAGGGPVGCPSTQHNCSGVCTDNDSTSLQSCGQTCMACTAPSGATATCDGTKCGYTCTGTTPKDCGQGVCVASTQCCADKDCTATSGGQTGSCDTGTHSCNYNCPSSAPKSCTVGGTTTCIATGSCCVNSDCSGNCMACDPTSHSCVAAKSEDDPNARCPGTCDATGTCRAKQGQTCNAVSASAGCVSGTTCSPDGYCCNTACTGSCVACDLQGLQGTCTNLPASSAPHSGHSACSGSGTCAGACGSAGACVYPTGSCGSGTCSGTGYVGTGTCSNGTCNTPAAQACSGHLICSSSTNMCKGSCTADADCLSGYFCETGTCHLAAVAVAAGLSHVCALLSDGTLRCWGDNSSGELGQGTFTTTGNQSIPTPVAVTLSKPATAVAAGSGVTYALLNDGTVWGWGSNSLGQLGQGTFTSGSGIATPGKVTGLPAAATAIASGSTHACAVVSGAVYCWGVDYDGDLGDGEYITTGHLGLATPAKVMGLQGTAAGVAAGGGQSCANLSGFTECWGDNSFGAVGTGSTTSEYNTAQSVTYTTPSPNVTAVAAANQTSCLLVQGGTVYCAGNNDDGELGNGSFANTTQLSFGPITNGPSGAIGAVAIAVGITHACALTSTGSIYCWGESDSGALGNGSFNTAANQDGLATPVQVTGLPSKASSISAGSNFTCAVVQNGSVWCWGSDISSQLGDGTTIMNASPVQVQGW